MHIMKSYTEPVHLIEYGFYLNRIKKKIDWIEIDESPSNCILAESEWTENRKREKGRQREGEGVENMLKKENLPAVVYVWDI